MPSAKSPNYTLLSRGDDHPLSPHQRRHVQLWKWAVPGLFSILVVISLMISQSMEEVEFAMMSDAPNPACPQYPPLGNYSDSTRKFRDEIMDILNSDSFLEKSIKNMQGAIQIPTEIFDDMGPVGEEKRFDIFQEFHEYLESTFPLVYSKLNVSKVNTYGIHMEWKGKDLSLKPYLFMGHQDVVPVPEATLSRWAHPPYSGHYDGQFVWGRGASDCKNVLIGILESFEVLLDKGFEPERTLLIAFGFDEEIGGWQGAQYLSQHIQDAKGKGSLELIMDEGGLGIQELYGAKFALPGVGEKGYMDVQVEVETAGGHSSVPPDHTGVGILSRIISAAEDNPFEPNLTPLNPFFTTLQCTAEYAPGISPWLRKAIKASLKSPKSAKEVTNCVAKKDIALRYLMQTSQATDIISGGLKINALPEKVQAIINHRIAVESNTDDIRVRYKSLVEKEILPRFPLALDAWGTISGNTSSDSAGKIILSDFQTPLEPSPISPYNSSAYKIFTGTIKQVFGEDYIVAPSVMTGNTDTVFYWELSSNIYRFSPVRDESRVNMHTVDERIDMKEHVEGVRFYVQMILNGGIPG